MSKDPLQQLLDNLRAKGGNALPTSSLGRLQKTASAAARIGMGALAGRLRGEEFNLASLPPEAVARLVETFGELKGVPMKAGQILSYVDGSLSPEARRLLAVLQVMSQPTAFSHIQRTIVEDLGPRGRALLARLERQPVASASIGQVHRAIREDGTRVAVKVRHPGIEEAIRADFRTAAVGTFFARLAVPGANVEGFVAEAEARFLEECNYRAGGAQTGSFWRDFRWPRVDHDSCRAPRRLWPARADFHLARRRWTRCFSRHGCLRSGENPGSARSL